MAGGTKSERLAGQRFVECRPVLRRRGLPRICLGNAEEFAAQGKFGFALAIGRESKMPDAYEPPGQDMQQEAADELLGLESHQLLFVSLPVIFPVECDLAVVEADQTVIGYGDPMCIAAEIVQDLMRAAEGRLRIDHPLDLAAAFEQGIEAFRIGQLLKGVMESELAGGVGFLEGTEKQAAEKARKNAHGKKEALATGDPAAAVG